MDYVPDAADGDDYRCFLLDPGLDRDAFVTGYEVIPGEPEIVHHAIVYNLNNPIALRNAYELDAEDPEPGWTCYGGSGAGGAGLVALAGPTGGASYYPEGTGIRLKAGTRVVLQVHYHLTDGYEKHEGEDGHTDRSTLALRLADAVEKEAWLFLVAVRDLELPPGRDLVLQTDEMVLPPAGPDATIWGVAPHMHELGKTFLVERIRGGESTCMAKVNDWNFLFQDFGEYTEPMVIKPGDTLRVTCGYDTRGQTETTYWGDSSTDEMCIN
ncbi:MAG: hypothetical protein M5R36_01495 [Deltaproteobacteria bacterium]|nr:hypothetical protein [Deltaproteobacteria bacterium]